MFPGLGPEAPSRSGLPSAARGQSLEGNWEIWPTNKPSVVRAHFFFFSGMGTGRESGGSDERNLGNRVKEDMLLVGNSFGTRGVGGVISWGSEKAAIKW